MRVVGCGFFAMLITGASAGFFEGSSSELALKDSYSYCIVGAGPGGLQLGHYLHKKSRDYIIFERQAIPSSFFARFPRHRQLISLNKRFTGRMNPEVSCGWPLTANCYRHARPLALLPPYRCIDWPLVAADFAAHHWYGAVQHAP
jgi:hypothetical protein